MKRDKEFIIKLFKSTDKLPDTSPENKLDTEWECSPKLSSSEKIVKEFLPIEVFTIHLNQYPN